VLRLVAAIAARTDPSSNMKSSTLKRALLDAELLGLVERQDQGFVCTSVGRNIAGAQDKAREANVLSAISQQPAVAVAARLLRADPATSPTVLGRAVAAEYGLTWTDGTALGCGKWLRGWMRAAGIATRMRRPSQGPDKQLSLTQ
jgi:hypothetical protein